MTHHSKPHCPDCKSQLKGVFCDLPDPCLEDFNARKTSNIYKKGQIIFYEGNNPFGVYCIFSGRVKLYKMGGNGRPQIVRLAGPGDILGYRSLFAEEPYHATAEALEKTEICCIDKGAFMNVVEKNPVLGFNLLRKLSKELGTAENMATNIAQKPARERMAELLLVLKKSFGKKGKKGPEIDLQLSREEMAEMIGTTQETAIRLLSDFKKENLILVQDREITILNTQALVKVANLDY